MLQSLHLRHILLIEKLDLQLGAGLNIISGESGAGKSLVLHSVALLLGARFNHSLLPSGQRQAKIIGVWQFDKQHPVFDTLLKQGFSVESGEPIIIRRQMGYASAIYLNDTPISVKGLSDLGVHFAEIYGQFGAHRLADLDYQRALLDDFAGLDTQIQQSRAIFHHWKNTSDQLEEVTRRHAGLVAGAGYLEHALSELEALDLQPNELENLHEQRQTIRQEVARMKRFDQALALLQGRAGASLAREVDAVQMALIGDDDGKTEEIIDTLERARIELAEAERSLENLRGAFYDWEAEQDRIEERLFRMSELARKHQTTTDRLEDLQQKMVEDVAEIERLAQIKHDLAVQVDRLRREMDRLHAQISAVRNREAPCFAQSLNAEFPGLNMATAEIAVRLTSTSAPSPTGCEQVQLFMRTQPTAPMQPLMKIASGGELSRILLAMALCLGRGDDSENYAQRLPLVFDEIDAGMGGETAALLGQRLKTLARTRQVLAVTHSPQMAASAQQHFGVRKILKDQKVSSIVTALQGNQRCDEVARMLAGETITNAARQAALALLAQQQER